MILPDALAETSGLYCDSDHMLSLNDSGNAPVLFKIDFNGNIIQQLPLAITNKDWEAVTADNTHYFIADVGNNGGKREQVEVYKINRQDLNDITLLKLSYVGNTITGNTPYAHDFDSEAMVKKGSELLLFSKSWRTGITHIYTIDEQMAEQHISPIADIKGLPGVVTGADFDTTRNVFVITGYKSDPFGNFEAFIAQVAPDFSIINIWPLETYKQVEGVCVDKKGQYWFSEEATKGRPASLSQASVN
ncbi:hypothetical protein D210916BOD24_00210 [Alteromonas sp. D210916BOD_24]